MDSHKFKVEKFGDILTVYLGDEPVDEWIRGIGKTVIMPELLNACECIINSKSNTKLCAVIISEVNFKSYNYHLSVKRKSMGDTLNKIMQWALENEEYKMCARVKKIQEL
jgi:hypothetical protein